MRAVFGSKIIATLQAFSYSVTREKAPIFVWGSPNPQGLARGKRGFAGTLVFVMLDQHALLSAMSQMLFVSNRAEVHPDFAAMADQTFGQQETASLALSLGLTADDTDAIESLGNPQNFTADYSLYRPWLVDQIPPFDVSILAVNEMGAAARMVVYGVEILNEGSGFSIDDLSVEHQMTWVGLNMYPWTRVPNTLQTSVQNQYGNL